jgi:transcriptional regulator
MNIYKYFRIAKKMTTSNDKMSVYEKLEMKKIEKMS